MKGPHGKGTQPSDWGLGAAKAARTPRNTALKTRRVTMRFIMRTQSFGEVLMSWGFFFVGLPPYATWTWTQMASVLRLRKLTSDMAYRKTIDTSGENPRVRGIAKLRATGISKVPYIFFMAHPESKENALSFFPYRFHI